MDNDIIEYNDGIHGEFRRYIGIGCFSYDDPQGPGIFFPYGKKSTLKNWVRYLENANATSINAIHSLVNYYGKDLDEKDFGKEFSVRFKENYENIKQINQKWWMFESTIFDFGVDFSSAEILDEIKEKVLDRHDNLIRIVFENGDVIKFTTVDISNDYASEFLQLYILESDYPEFLSDIKTIVSFFKQFEQNKFIYDFTE